MESVKPLYNKTFHETNVYTNCTNPDKKKVERQKMADEIRIYFSLFILIS